MGGDGSMCVCSGGGAVRVGLQGDEKENKGKARGRK